MTVADLSLINTGLNTEQTYNALNSLFVDYEKFSKVSNLYSRAYGVINDADGGLKTNDRDDVEMYRTAPLNSFVLNDCLRSALWVTLLTIQNETEDYLGFNLTPRYHTEEIIWPRSGKVQLTWPGLEKLEVEQNWYDITDFDAQTLSYFIETGVTIIEDPDNASKQAIVVDGSLVKNPNDIIIRNETSNQIIDRDSYNPVWTGTDWRIRINHLKPSPTSVGQDVNIQHRRIIYLDITTPDTSDLPSGGTVYPVYPGTNQIIPQAQPSEDIGGGQTRYFFYAYTLVDPAFKFETVYWNRGEFYKFYKEIEFKYLVEEKAYLEFIWIEGDDTYTYQYDPEDAELQATLNVQIAVEKSSIIHLYINDKLVCELIDLLPFWRRACDGCKRTKMPETARIKIKYKTNPANLSVQYRNQIAGLQTTVAGRVASELPTEDCGCSVEIGFIEINQRVYGSRIVNNVTGIEVERVKYGQRQGQVAWTEALQNATIYRRSLVLGTMT